MTDVREAMSAQADNKQDASKTQKELLSQLPEQLREDLGVIDQVVGEREGNRWEHITLQQRMTRIMEAVVQGHQARKELKQTAAVEGIKSQFEKDVFEEPRTEKEEG